MATPLALGALGVVCFGWASAVHADTPSPVATISPASGLTDGEVVTVTGSGFPAFQNIIVAECQGTAADPPRDDNACQGNTADTSTYTDSAGAFDDSSAAGSGTSGYAVHVRTESGLTGIDCDARHACVLYVGTQLDNFDQPHVFVDLAWAPTALATSSGTSPAPAPGPTALTTPTTAPAPAGAGPATRPAGPAAARSPTTASPTAPLPSAAVSASAGSGTPPPVDPTVSLAGGSGSLPQTGSGRAVLVIAGLAFSLLAVGSGMRLVLRDQPGSVA